LPTLLALKDVLLAVPGLETAIGRAVDPQGVVLDGASRELARIRGQLAGAHNRVVAHLEGLLEGVDERHRVPGASVSIREGRYVIPLRREGRRAVGGYVHDESSSGATLFVEPPSAIEMMNRVRGLERAEAREVLRILRDLSERCRPLAGAMADSLGALTEMDRRVALARAAGRWDGCVPEMTDGPVCIRGGRHPLLVAAGIEPVPFDLELDQDEGVVVVTGPNTGGKTVFLKSVGLVSALAQSGVVPPTGPGTRLPVFTSFFAESGDGQSIADSLSTCSAHLGSLRTILENAESRSLVLIDEPGAGTDPREGEALARALVENFAGQWLHLRNVADWTPDPERFPHFDDGIRHAFQRETQLFLEHLVRDDRSVLELLDADYTFLNEGLAEFYGIDGVEGGYFRQVPLAAARRLADIAVANRSLAVGYVIVVFYGIPALLLLISRALGF